MDILNISEVKELFQQGKLRGLVVLAVDIGGLSETACHLCGTVIEDEYVVAIIFQDGEAIGSVCPDCLKVGPRVAAQRIRDYVVQRRQEAEVSRQRTKVWLKELVESAPLIEALPLEAWATVDELKAMSNAVDLEIVKDKLGESGAMTETLEPGEIPF